MEFDTKMKEIIMEKIIMIIEKSNMSMASSRT